VLRRQLSEDQATLASGRRSRALRRHCGRNSLLELIGKRLAIRLELERNDRPLLLERAVLARQLAVALAELGRTRDELNAFLRQRLVACDRRRDIRELLPDAFLRASVAG